MTARHLKIKSEILMDVIAAAIGAPGGTEAGAIQRLVLDLQANKPAAVYVKYIGDTRMLDIDWPVVLGGDAE